MFKPPSPVTMAAKSSASVFTGRVKVNRLILVPGYHFFAVEPPKDECAVTTDQFQPASRGMFRWPLPLQHWLREV